MQLAGKVALVTGAARRVGRAIALELGAAGARVIVHHHASPEPARAVGRMLGDAAVVQADLRTAAGVEKLFGEVERLGGIDLLCCSAANFVAGKFLELDDAAWQEALALNLLAPARCARRAAPGMRQRGGGVIVNILDVAALVPWRGYAAHCVAKAGLAMLTKCLALELAPEIRTVAVVPGTVEFPQQFSEAQRERIRRRIPLGRTGSSEDVARAVRFLAESEFINGALLAVDGGRLVDAGEPFFP